MAKQGQIKKVSLLDYAANHNPKNNRRGHPMTFSYLYRLIRETEEGTCKRELWFKYELDKAHKDRIWIIL